MKTLDIDQRHPLIVADNKGITAGSHAQPQNTNRLSDWHNQKIPNKKAHLKREGLQSQIRTDATQQN
jgi:hypothetical protein